MRVMKILYGMILIISIIGLVGYHMNVKYLINFSLSANIGYNLSMLIMGD